MGYNYGGLAYVQPWKQSTGLTLYPLYLNAEVYPLPQEHQQDNLLLIKNEKDDSHGNAPEQGVEKIACW